MPDLDSNTRELFDWTYKTDKPDLVNIALERTMDEHGFTRSAKYQADDLSS